MKEKIRELYSQKKESISAKLNEFKSLPEKSYLKEHLFCILTPQSNAKSCWSAVQELSNLKEVELKKETISKVLKGKTRFHNNKAKYIEQALNNWEETKKELSSQDIPELRNKLAKNVKGYGLKEASHFLRNIGKSNNKIAILDRHILKNMALIGVISEEKIKNKQDYLDKEQKFIALANELKIEPDALDLIFWSQQTGEIFK